MADATEVAKGLREMADWLDLHSDEILRVSLARPKLELPTTGAAELGHYARMMAPCTKNIGEYVAAVGRVFSGGVMVEAYAARSLVCERVDTVVTEEVTEPDPELLAQVPLVTRTVERTETRWECPDSLLRDPAEHYAHEAELAEAQS